MGASSGRPAPDPVGPVDEEDHAGHGAHRGVAHPARAAARPAVAAVRRADHRGDRDVAGQADELEHPLLEERSAPSGRGGVRRDLGPRPGRRLQLERAAHGRGAVSQASADEGMEPKLFVAGRKGIVVLPVPRPAGRGVVAAASPRRRPTTTPRRRRRADRGVHRREVDEIHGVYTEFASALTQRARGPAVRADGGRGDGRSRRTGPLPLYMFEPDPQEHPRRTSLPRYVETRVFAALLEAAASEHAARRRAMSAATDNADELIKDLTRHRQPGPAGGDHDRDHGDRRRGRGAAPGAARRAATSWPATNVRRATDG